MTTRNREQNFAVMNLLMDPDVDFVTPAPAGTGKTLMALAAGLTQVLDDRRYTEIIMTRATVSVGEDIGFLPGTEKKRWALDGRARRQPRIPGQGRRRQRRRMGPRHQRADPQPHQDQEHELHARAHVHEQVRHHRRGAEPHAQADEDLITRAGPGTKIICMGNLAQIDTPYLTEGSSGLTFAVDRFKGWPHSGHITLCEPSLQAHVPAPCLAPGSTVVLRVRKNKPGFHRTVARIWWARRLARRPGAVACLCPLSPQAETIALPAGARLTASGLAPGTLVDTDALLQRTQIRAGPGRWVGHGPGLADTCTLDARVEESLQALAHAPSVTQAARSLGVSPRTLERLLHRHTAHPPAFWRSLARVRQTARCLAPAPTGHWPKWPITTGPTSPT